MNLIFWVIIFPGLLKFIECLQQKEVGACDKSATVNWFVKCRYMYDAEGSPEIERCFEADWAVLMFQLTLQAPLNSDKLLFSPCNITSSSNVQVLRIAETITNDESSLCLNGLVITW